MSKLKFDQHLVSTAASPISLSDLLKRLKTLAQELEALDQENVQRASLLKIAGQLTSTNLLQHKNKGVSAYVACCLSDLLRLCAPDAPFSQTQLRSIFECFIRQLKGLGNVEGTYFQQNHYLLESLATVESVVLLGDIDKGDQLIVEVFRTFFDIASDGQRRPKIDDYMISIMTQLIDEVQQLGTEVLEILLAHMMKPRSGRKHAFAKNNVAYDIAKAVFINCADRLQRNVCQYFTDVIFDASRRDVEEESDVDDERLKIAHDLVLELFISAPTTLQNVIPQLESELNVESNSCRILATETISSMLACPNGSLLLQQYPSTYKAWAGRRNDKIVAIRVAWTEGIGRILAEANGAIREESIERLCIDGLLTRLVDTDEKVRLAACRVIENIDYSTAKKRLTKTLIKTYSERCRDKKQATQEAALKHIGKLFDLAYSDISKSDEVAIDKFGILVNQILHCVYINDNALNILIERTLYEDILGSSIDLDDDQRIERLLQTLSLTDERSRRAFFAITGQLQKTNAAYLAHFLKCLEHQEDRKQHNAERTIDEHLEKCIAALAHRMPMTTTVEADLRLLAQKNDRKLFKSISLCIDPNSNYSLVRKTMREVSKRAAQTSLQIADTLDVLVRRAAYQVFNRSSVLPLMKASLEGADVHRALAQTTLNEMAIHQPQVYKAHVSAMITTITRDPLETPCSMLKAFAHFSRSYPNDLPESSELLDALAKLMTQGAPELAKQAVTIACQLTQGKTIAGRIALASVGNLAYGSDHFLTQLAVLAQVSLISPSMIEERSNEITSFCVKELLMKNRLVREEQDMMTWSEDVEEECTAKCLAIRLLGNRLRGYHAAETAPEIALPVFKALRSLVINMGELSKSEDTPLAFRARLRLEAANMVLKLAVLPVYDRLISVDDFTQVALFAQDLEYNVRKRFLTHLSKSLAARKLPARWHTILFLAAHDPEDEIRNEMRSRAASLAAQHRKFKPDRTN